MEKPITGNQQPSEKTGSIDESIALFNQAKRQRRDTSPDDDDDIVFSSSPSQESVQLKITCTFLSTKLNEIRRRVEGLRMEGLSLIKTHDFVNHILADCTLDTNILAVDKLIYVLSSFTGVMSVGLTAKKMICIE